jgi:hypothetical protein
MAVTSTITPEEIVEASSFPAIMIDPMDGAIMLMHDNYRGIVLHRGNGPHAPGHMYTALAGPVARRIRKYTGIVTLENPK